jgi:uncharacterized membrane protein
MRSPLTWPILIIGSALGVGLVVLGNVISPVRHVIALWFLLVCPGMAFVRLLRIKDPISEWTLAVALSLTTGSILATTMIYAKLWSPKWGLGILIGISVFGAILQVIASYRHALQERRQHQ